ncbi:hypothetical protein DITRI_Ditri03aG0219600 [Diplodiscus trichospermus]
MDFSISSSSSSSMSCFPVEKARELCCSAVSAVITKLLYAIFIFLFAVVGATLGAMAGAFIGAKTKTGCLHGATIGAIKGSVFSIKLFKISLRVFSSDDMATMNLLQPINAFGSTLNVSWNEGLSKNSIEKIPKIRITEENAWDSSSNRISCSICLQVFHLFPQCFCHFCYMILTIPILAAIRVSCLNFHSIEKQLLIDHSWIWFRISRSFCRGR